MRKGRRLFLEGLAVVLAAGLGFTACSEEPEPLPEPEPEPEPVEEYEDSTGVRIVDSVLVDLGEDHWGTLDYTAYIQKDESGVQDWLYLKANKPGSTYPYFKLKILCDTASAHSSRLNVVTPPGVDYSVPGSLTGDSRCGTIEFYQNRILHAPDGTLQPDWWPLDITMQVLKYSRVAGKVTAKVTGHMFHYEEWLDSNDAHNPINVSAAESRELTITFGGLKAERE